MSVAGVRGRLGVELRYSGTSAWRAVTRLANGNDLTYAASIAYYALLSFFPFLLLVISVLGVLSASDGPRVELLAFVFQYFPTRLDFVAEQLDALAEARLGVGLAGGLALAWASLGVFGAITSAVNAAWGVDRQRSFLRHRLVSFLMLLASGGILTLALLLAGAGPVVRASWFGNVLARNAWLSVVVTWVTPYLSVVLLVIGVGLMFYFIPNTRTRLRDVWVGAILTGLLWRAAFWGFAWIIGRNERLALIHGSITAVVVFLLWIYVSAVILMYGVEFTASYARLRRQAGEDRLAVTGGHPR